VVVTVGKIQKKSQPDKGWDLGDMVAVRCLKIQYLILSQKCVRSKGVDVVPPGVKTAVPRACAGVFARLICPEAAKHAAQTADLNPRPHCILRSLVGAILSDVAYGPGTHWVEERTTKSGRSGSALPARAGAVFWWHQGRAIPSPCANFLSILQLTNIFRSSLERMSGLR